MRSYNIIGVMSGTSMDGLDIAHFTLSEREDKKWDYKINHAKTIPYGDKWRLRLSKLRNQSSLVFYKTDRFFGQYIGECIADFLDENSLDADLIASHGHTIFHQPHNNLSVQIGDGNSITAMTGIPSVTNFRAMDVIFGGHGAPLSAVGDELLFSEYDVCLNIGGFANISSNQNGARIGFDICPANILFNRIAREFGKDYDENGTIAESGKIDYQLLDKLNKIEYYHQSGSKTLGREWINDQFWFNVRESGISKEDKMKTLCDHVGSQIGNNIEDLTGGEGSVKRVLATGGGVHNKTLIDHIKTHTDVEIVIPDDMLVKYKEALIFALLGILRVKNIDNIYKSVTGADDDVLAGSLHGNFSDLL
ncbi:MAG: hypothetical protein CBB99_04860 [Bacteroidetes bacterium TMED39]|nr:MAG: hypothetical protein CBB99_04860 [Bacteroidetes bacterium TMED39]|tara:strand:+ start:1759 stop:2850 length:1092 start_codon:yes stop_codon:yes gene_type:complete